jgi:hypothetical protein
MKVKPSYTDVVQELFSIRKNMDPMQTNFRLKHISLMK